MTTNREFLGKFNTEHEKVGTEYLNTTERMPTT